jgi:hypothetical protein
VVAISDTGVQVVSREIEPEITPLLTYGNCATYTSALAYESERSYLLSTVESSSDTAATQIFIYNAFTRTWCRWTFGFSAAVIESSVDKMYFAKAGQSAVYEERKEFTDNDYADPEVDITLISVSGDTVEFSITGTTPEAGWLIKQGSAALPIDSVVSTGASQFQAVLVYDAPVTWAPGAGTAIPSVGMDIEWHVWSAGQPALLKQVRQVALLTDSLTSNNTATRMFATFRSDIDPSEEEVQIDSTAVRWGSKPWGAFPWGGSSDTYAYPTYVPRNKQYLRTLNLGIRHATALEKMSVSGCSFTFEMISERVSR